MKRFLLTTIILIAFGQSIFAQGKLFSFIYVRPDYTMDVDILKTKLHKAINEYQGNSFVVYYSGINPFVMTSDNYDENRLLGAISSQNSTVSLTPLQEIENLSAVLESNLQLQLSQDEFGYQTISSAAGYGSIDIKCFVGDNFIKSDNVNAVFARLMVVNNIGVIGGVDVGVTFYPCGASYNETAIQFNKLYGINTKPVIEQ